MATNNSLNTYIVPTTANEITMPSQPAFLATPGGAQDDVTGDATVHTVIFSNVEFDQNSDFDGTSTFTAPVTGIYQINVAVKIGDLAVGNTTSEMFIATTTSSLIDVVHAGNLRNAVDEYTHKNSVILPLTAANTVFINIKVQGGGKVVDVINDDSTFFSVALIA